MSRDEAWNCINCTIFGVAIGIAIGLFLCRAGY